MKPMLLLCLAALLLLATASAGQASWLTEIASPVLEFAGDTIITPDATGVVLGDPFTLDFQKQWVVGNVPGVKELDLYGGITIDAAPPALGGISTIAITNIKGNQLVIGVKTDRAETSRWVVDIPGVFRVGVQPIVAVQRKW